MKVGFLFISILLATSCATRSTISVETYVDSAGRLMKPYTSFYFNESEKLLVNKQIKICRNGFVTKEPQGYSLIDQLSKPKKKQSQKRLVTQKKKCTNNPNCLVVNTIAKMNGDTLYNTSTVSTIAAPNGAISTSAKLSSQRAYDRSVKLEFQNPRTKKTLHEIKVKSEGRSNTLSTVLKHLCYAAGKDSPLIRNGTRYVIRL